MNDSGSLLLFCIQKLATMPLDQLEYILAILNIQNENSGIVQQWNQVVTIHLLSVILAHLQGLKFYVGCPSWHNPVLRVLGHIHKSLTLNLAYPVQLTCMSLDQITEAPRGNPCWFGKYMQTHIKDSWLSWGSNKLCPTLSETTVKFIKKFVLINLELTKTQFYI